MALQRQVIPVYLPAGMDTKPDEKALQLDKFKLVQNASIKKMNQQKRGSIGKRHGYAQMSIQVQGSSSTLTGIRKMAVYEDELLAISGDKIYSYNDSNLKWVDKGNISSVAFSEKSIVKKNADANNPDVAESGGLRAYAYEAGSGTNVTIIDSDTGNILLYDTVLSTDHGTPRVIAAYNRIYFYYYRSADSTIKFKYVDITSPTTLSAEGTLATNAAAANFSMDIILSGSTPIFSYFTSGSQYRIGYLRTDGAIAGPSDGSPAAITTAYSTTILGRAVSIAARREGGIWDGIYHTLVESSGGNNRITTYKWNTSLTTNTQYVIYSTGTTADPFDQITTYLSSVNMLYVFFQVTPGSGGLYKTIIRANTLDAGGSVGTVGVFARAVGLSGKAFLGADSELYVVASHESTDQNASFLLKYVSNTKASVASAFSSGFGAGLRGVGKISSIGYNAGAYYYPLTVVTQYNSDNGTLSGIKGIHEIAISFNQARSFSFSEINNVLFLGGGLPQVYDGATAFESNFNLYPEIISNATGAGSITAGTRSYVAIYEWQDAKGNTYRSTPSAPLSATNGAAAGNTLTLLCLNLTQKTAAFNRDEVRIVLYRTSDAGTTYYRVTSLTSPLLNVPGSESVTFNDTAADTSITSNEVLYTSGGILENVSPSSAGHVNRYKNRLVISKLEDKGLALFSKKTLIGDAPAFSDLFEIRVDEGRGGINATASLDEKLILFKDDDIFVTAGEGPEDTGVNYDFPQPALLSTDAGCPYPQSIVLTPLGVMFKSSKGFYLLDRALQVSYKGAAVEDYNSLTVEDAELFENDNEVRFIHSDGEMLVYNYYLDEWTIYSNHLGYSTVNWQQNQVVLKTNGSIWLQDDSYTDAGAAISTKIVIPWIATGGIQSFQRIYLIKFLGRLITHHKLRVGIEYDYREGEQEVKFYDSLTVQGSNYFGQDAHYGDAAYFGGADSLYQFEIAPRIQKCQAIRFTLEDIYPNGATGAGFSLTGMTMTVGLKKSAFKDKVGRRVA